MVGWLVGLIVGLLVRCLVLGLLPLNVINLRSTIKFFFFKSFSLIVCIHRDDAAEFDDGAVDLAGHVDNREVVVWRKSNKVSHNHKSFWIL